MLATIGAAFEPAVAPMPGFSGFGSSMIDSTMYCGSSIGKAATKALKRLSLE